MTDERSDDGPAVKRVKVDDNSHWKSDENELGIINPHLLSNTEKQKQAYLQGKPFPHGRIRNMFDLKFLKGVFEEIKMNSKVKFKESDLFRVYQSIDLGNLTAEDRQQLPFLTKLKATVYSKPYREFIESITNLPPNTLTEQTDCAANCHAPGCHLLCHDDVIGTRKISFILYLTEEQWTAEEGGALELYENGAVVPSNTLLPEFNSMAYFEVRPMTSFHSVQEVFGDRPRLSIQGWYHATACPENMEQATLSQLKAAADDDQTDDYERYKGASDAPSVDDVDAPKLSEIDRAYLSQFINDIYLEDKSMTDIRQRFEEDSSVQLRHFLRQDWIDKINQVTKDQDPDGPALDYQLGVSSQWNLVGPPHKQRYLECNPLVKSEEEDDVGSVLTNLLSGLFQTKQFGCYLKLLTSLGMPLGFKGCIRRFRPGLDYTVAHHGILTQEPVLDATLCFVKGSGEQCHVDEATGDLIGNDADIIWESGDVGGFECYIEADDENAEQEAADEYQEDDDTELLSLSASNNTLSLVYRDPGTMRFVKYVGCRAPSSRLDISMEYQVFNDDNTNSDGENG